MNVVAWIVLGGAAGWIASIIMNVEGNLPRDIIVGIVGALIGGCIMSLVSSQDFGEFNLWSILAALICSIALLGALDYAIQHGIRR